MKLEKILAKNIKIFRSIKNLTQKELADKIGMHSTYLSNLENAKYSTNLRTVQEIAQALEIEPIMLLKEIK